MEKGTILLVEDEAVVAMEIQAILQNLGYSVIKTVDTGEKAICKTEQYKPDLVLMDIRIKGEIDGIDAAEEIRSRFGIPVVFSTAYLDKERIKRAKLTMPFGYILKPIQERELIVTIEMALYVSKVDKERKKAEEELRTSEKRFQYAMEASSDGIFDWNLKTGEIYFSPGYFAMLGYEPNELPHSMESFKKLLHPDDTDRMDQNISRFMTGDDADNNMELRLKGKNGEWIWVLSRAKVVEFDETGAAMRMVGTNSNINEIKRVEEVLEYEKWKAQHYMDIAGVSLIALDVNGCVTMINPKGCETLGYEESEIIGRNWFDHFIPNEIILEIKQVFRQVVQQGLQPVDYHENEILRKDGTRRSIAWHNSVLRDRAGKIIGLLSSGEDITKRKQAEKELKESENRLATIYNSTSNYMCLLGIELPDCFRMVSVNEAYNATVKAGYPGMSKDDILGLTLEEAAEKLNWPQYVVDMAIQSYKRVIRTGKPVKVIEEVPTRDETLYLESTYTPIIDENGVCTHILYVTHDISQLKRAEANLKALLAEKEAKLQLLQQSD